MAKKFTKPQLEKEIEKYHEFCKESESFPSEAGLIYFLEITESDYELMLQSDNLLPVLERERLWRVAWLENKMVTDPRCSTGCMNALRQEHNGGYRDRNSGAAGKNKKLIIELKGVGKGAFE